MTSLPPELLRSFVAVVQTQSFTRAAERVYLSQSTVSQQIRRLEALIGKTLFERDTRTVTPTRDGEALMAYATRILDLMSDAVDHFRGESLSGHVRLGLSEDFASAGLTAALAQFARRHPALELSIAIGMSGDLFRELDDDHHDIVFAKRLEGSLRGHLIRREPLVWCAGPVPLNLDEQQAVPLVLHPVPSVTRLRMLQSLDEAGRPYRIAVSSTSLAALKASVMAGLGVSAFARYLIPEGLTQVGQSLPALGALEFVIDKQKKVSQAVTALEATLMAAAREL